MKETCYIAKGAQIVGDVTMEDGVNIWYNAVVRGDHGAIRIGAKTNIQDNCTVHTQIGHSLTIGRGVTIGHGAIIHGIEIGDNSLIGMGAILLNGTRIGKNCIIGAGALLTQGMVVPDGMLAFGSPARVVRPLTEEEIASNKANCKVYLALMEEARG